MIRSSLVAIQLPLLKGAKSVGGFRGIVRFWEGRFERGFIDSLTDNEKHTQTRKPLRQAYKGTLRSG